MKGVGIFFAFLLVPLMVLVAAVLWYLARKQMSWLQVPGIVTNSEVRMGSGRFHPHVRYEYEHLGRRYHGERVVSCEITYNWRHRSNKVVARYPVNRAVTVYIDPKYPTSSVLEPGGDRHFWPAIATVAGFLLLISWLTISQP